MVPPLPVGNDYSSGLRRWCCSDFSPPFCRPGKRKISQVLLSFHISVHFNSTHAHIYTHHATKCMQLSLYLITADFLLYLVLSHHGTQSRSIRYGRNFLLLFLCLWNVESWNNDWTKLKMVDWLSLRVFFLYSFLKLKNNLRFYEILMQV